MAEVSDSPASVPSLAAISTDDDSLQYMSTIPANASSKSFSVAVEDQSVAPASTLAVDGSFSRSVDWAVIGLEIKPGQ